MNVHIIHTGKVKVDRAIPLYEKNPLAKTGIFRADKKLILPVSCYLIEHEMGNILIDAGWDSKYAFERPKQFFGIVDKISSPIISKNEGIDVKLQEIGFSIDDISKIFITHMDFDHTSGLRLLRNVNEIYTSKEELKEANKFSFRYIDTWSEFVNIKAFEYSASAIGPVGRSFDVFGDGKIQLIHIPGHSKGLFAVKIENNGKYIILASDGAYLQESFEKRIIPGFNVCKTDAYKSLDWLCECRKDKSCLGVFPNHDPTIKEQTIKL